MKHVLFVSLAFLSWTGRAETGEWFFDPHGAVGFNPAQGTHVIFGIDLGVQVSEQLRLGVGAYAAAGEQAADDREFGVGPFASYVQPFATFLVGQLRQELNYVDIHDPIKTNTPTGTTYSHTKENGIASVTSASLHILFTRNFVLSGGYRFVLGLTNEALDDGRSGAFVGLSLGF